MTIKELIDELKHLPPEIKVVVRGYENGYNDVVSLKRRNINVNKKAEWWDGRYLDSAENESISAVELFGDNEIPIK